MWVNINDGYNLNLLNWICQCVWLNWKQSRAEKLKKPNCTELTAHSVRLSKWFICYVHLTTDIHNVCSQCVLVCLRFFLEQFLFQSDVYFFRQHRWWTGATVRGIRFAAIWMNNKYKLSISRNSFSINEHFVKLCYILTFSLGWFAFALKAWTATVNDGL